MSISLPASERLAAARDGAERARPRVALFDLDRTLVRRDTASLYVRYQRDIGEAGLRDALRVGWWLMQYSVGVIDAEKVAERALEDFRGRSESRMEETCKTWFRGYVKKHIAERARQVVREHLDAGDTVAIVTGATRFAAEPVARELEIEHVVCTQLEVTDDRRFTGRVCKPMCYGEGKITLANKLLSSLGLGLDDAVFYTDSITDLPLLEEVALPVVVNPDRRLRRLASRRNWRVESWR